MYRKVTSGRKVSGATISLGNAMSLQFECVRVLHETLLVAALLFGIETMVWRENTLSTIKIGRMDNLRGLLAFRTMDGVPNPRVR